jgi:ATP-dependent Clp protease protease subunit
MYWRYILDKASPNTFIKSHYSLENRMLYITNLECEEEVAFIKRALLVLQQISNEPIDIYIDSFGGCVYSGLGLYDLIADSNCWITTYASGKVMSMGLILFCAGDTRLSTMNTTFMAHGLSSGTSGKVKNQEIDIKEAKRLNIKLLQILADKTNKSFKWWDKKLEHEDYYFDVEEAKKLKLIKK